ncbi:acyltransferase [Streptomyces sp. NPDC007063]|uniref:acyltransferase n=1 Tax=Streptomyces sp. NPDC007063 TaxID=3364772 RepID=UPI00367C3ED8
MSTEETLRLTVAALLNRTGEQQADLAAAIDLSPTGLSRRQSGRLHWSLDDCDRLAAHWGISTLDLLSGPSHAADTLPADRLPSVQTALATPADKASVPRPQRPATEPASPAPAVETAAPTVAPPDPGQAHEAAPCMLCGRDTTARAGGKPQHIYGMCIGGQPPTAAQAIPAAPAAPDGTASPKPDRLRPAESDLGLTIKARVRAVLKDKDGDAQAAQKFLVEHAIPDVMEYFQRSRVGGRYEHKDFPPTHDVLKKRSQKGADDIWEGRPNWSNKEFITAVLAGEIDSMEVAALDMNAAYLAAFKTRLPLGQLVLDTSGVHDPKKSGVHLITPPAWEHADLPSPLGNRKSQGQVWVTEPTLRLLLECAQKWDLCEAPVIHQSLTSGSTEALLEKLRRALADIRMEAITAEDTVTVEYVKQMYSKFVSTMGESGSNRDIRRPDWMHILRSQAFANLWRKAHKARNNGLTVVKMMGTDELHVMGDWRNVFEEGQGLPQVKNKDTYTLEADK